ncbi:MAG: 1-acyl-sn-glycerol-3-phosphate acyltransferase [Clostridiales bacterium]|jgi:1-acyl-sn-glycerol-3-phosphate acyltransferase|nr:1-acyl-sn-glycerol-3-phosphate acyltransferase [Clostridiales bacterium]
MEENYLLYRIVVFFFRLFCITLHFPKINGKKNIPKKGKCIICANHKSNIDVVVLASFSPRTLHFMAKEEMFKNKFSNKFFRLLYSFPVRRTGAGIETFKKAISVLNNENVLTMFPEGRRVKEQFLDEGKMGCALIALKSKTNVVPIGIKGNYKPFKRITVNIGKEIDLSKYFNKKINKEILREVTNLIMENISELSGISNKNYEGA